MKRKPKTKTALSKKLAWYDEVTFISELIAKFYTYMANEDRALVQSVFERLGARYGFKFVPIASASHDQGA